jgi:hypothetical protein
MFGYLDHAKRGSFPRPYGFLRWSRVTSMKRPKDEIRFSAVALCHGLYHCHFEIRLCSAKEGGTAVSAVLRLGHLLAPSPSEPRSTTTHTGGTHCAPLLKSKSKLLLVLPAHHASAHHCHASPCSPHSGVGYCELPLLRHRLIRIRDGGDFLKIGSRLVAIQIKFDQYLGTTTESHRISSCKLRNKLPLN